MSVIPFILLAYPDWTAASYPKAPQKKTKTNNIAAVREYRGFCSNGCYTRTGWHFCSTEGQHVFNFHLTLFGMNLLKPCRYCTVGFTFFRVTSAAKHSIDSIGWNAVYWFQFWKFKNNKTTIFSGFIIIQMSIHCVYLFVVNICSDFFFGKHVCWYLLRSSNMVVLPRIFVCCIK